MKKKVLFFCLATIFLLTWVGVVMALEKGNKRKGKYIYRKVYKACYERGEVDSAKPPINPDAKTQAEWTQVFEQKEFDEFGCKTEWSNLSESDLGNIFAYLHDHAADSPTPLKCK